MKNLLIGLVIGGVFFFSNISVCRNEIHLTSTTGEGGLIDRGPLYDPEPMFQYIRFDDINRGSYNQSDCLLELLNCLEVVRGDMICTYTRMTESICGTLKNDCNELFGKFDNNEYQYTLMESFCNPSIDEQYFT